MKQAFCTFFKHQNPSNIKKVMHSVVDHSTAKICGINMGGIVCPLPPTQVLCSSLFFHCPIGQVSSSSNWPQTIMSTNHQPLTNAVSCNPSIKTTFHCLNLIDPYSHAQGLLFVYKSIWPVMNSREWSYKAIEVIIIIIPPVAKTPQQLEKQIRSSFHNLLLNKYNEPKLRLLRLWPGDDETKDASLHKHSCHLMT